MSEVQLLPRAAEAVRLLRAAGWPVVLVTNKTAVGWRLLSRREHEAVMGAVLGALAAAGAGVEAWYACTHAGLGGCDCRKPRPGMLLRAARELGLDLARSWMVGDSWRDVAAGRAAGCRTVLVGAGSRRAVALRPEFHVADLWEAVGVILREGRDESPLAKA